MNLETKFHKFDWDKALSETGLIEGYASLFDHPDQGRDVVQKGAYQDCLERLAERGISVKMLWQHDPAQPIGVWDEIYEDEIGLYVKGRILTEINAGKDAFTLIKAGAIDGLSIGYQTKKSSKNNDGFRLLKAIELWEVSLVTFPMLPEARVTGSAMDPDAQDLAVAIEAARHELLA